MGTIIYLAWGSVSPFSPVPLLPPPPSLLVVGSDKAAFWHELRFILIQSPDNDDTINGLLWGAFGVGDKRFIIMQGE